MVNQKCTFQIAEWKENPSQSIEDTAKITVVHARQSWSGAIEGTGQAQYLLSYTAQGTASFVGIERVSASVEGKTGTFVIRHVGQFVDGRACSEWIIIDGAGTNDLIGLHGKGSYIAHHGEPAQVTFDFYYSAENINGTDPAI